MKLNAPKFVTWLVALVIAFVGVIGYILAATGGLEGGWVMPLSFWLEALAVVVLAGSTALAKV